MTPTPHADAADGGASKQPPRRRFRETALASGLLDMAQIDAAEAQARAVLGAGDHAPDRLDKAAADVLVGRGQLTKFQAGQMLLGRSKLSLNQYRILDQVGQGGMGRVFKAQHAMMRRIVAIKVLTKDKATAATEAAFLREIERLGDLDHENLLRALDAGRDGKVYYLVTEYVEGLDLRRQVLRHGPLDEWTGASVIVQAARGLACAHDQGVVHRDVKPGNLLATKEGRVKVLDLGLAGSVFDMQSSASARVIGTMDYMAPEQVRNPANARAPADIYGLGCTLYFLLTGQVPFPGGTREEKAQRQLTQEPVPLRRLAPQVSQPFARVVEAMMRKNPAERLASAHELLERLRQWTPEQPLPMPRRRHPQAPGGQQPGAYEQASSRDSTQGPMSLSEETAGGSSAASTASVDSVGEVFHPEPVVSPSAAGQNKSVRVDRGRVARPAGLVQRLATWFAPSGGFRQWVGLHQLGGLRRAGTSAAVAFVLSWGIGTLCAWLGIDAPRLPLLVGGLAFAAIFGVQAWAARSARPGDD
jgi:serine/threonine protein kinase